MSANYPPEHGTPGTPGTAGNTNAGSTAGRDTERADVTRSATPQTASLRDDLNTLKNDVNALASRASALSETELQDAYGELITRFSSVRHAAKGVAAQAGQQFNQRVDATTTYVKDKPMQAVGYAAAAGLLLGLLL